MNIIQFMPYFPPHKGGLETVGEEIGINWQKSDLGDFINVITSFSQSEELEKNEKIIFKGEVIGYIKNGVKNLIIPSFEVITNFPVFKLFNKQEKLVYKYLSEYIATQDKNDIKLLTHTRFFLPCFFGGKFARKNKIEWIHIEHGSTYVILSSKLYSFVAYMYDRIIGKWIFKKADKILAISGISREFILNNFVARDIGVFYRGINIPKIYKKAGDIKLFFIGRLVALKGVKDLVEAYKKSSIKNELIIIGDGEEKKDLEEKSKGFNISFLGAKDNKYIVEYLGKNNIIQINPSYSEGLPTTVIEGLLTGNVVVATDVGGTKEISNQKDLILIKPGNIYELIEKLKYAISEYDNLKGLSRVDVEKKFNWEDNIIKLYDSIK